MLQAAAKIWGYPETDAASDFDPLVSLLLSVNAAELERLSNEIQHSRIRIMERMVQLMAPDVLTGPLPASAVLYALSTDNQTMLGAHEQFFYSRRVAAASESEPVRNKDLYFTPAGNFFLNKCAVHYMATGNKLFRYTDTLTKELVAYTQGQAALAPNVLWLAIDQCDISLHNTQFYFQIRNEVNKPVFYNQLPQGKWYINGQSVQVKKGYNSREEDALYNQVEQLLQQGGIAAKVLQQVRKLFAHCFITLTDADNISAHSAAIMPEAISKVFAPHQLQALLARSVRWVQVVFPENITSEMLEDVNCFTNCIPIVNRRLHDVTYRLQEMANVLPLTTDDQFFDVASVTDDNGSQLHLRNPSKEAGEDIDILFRSGGAGRFDERDATAVIQNLIQLLRDESAAFSRLGRDLIAEETRQLQQVITKLEQLLAQKQPQAERVPYLIIRKGKHADVRHLFVKYWSTNGAMGNDIKAGTPLLPYKTGAVNHAVTCLLTNTHGGRDRLTQADSVVAYKQAVLSKDRVMSQEDIRLFVLGYFGNRVKRIEVEKGVMVAVDTSKGFVKTIDVKVVLEKKAYLDAMEKNEVNYWKEHLALQLADRSMAFMPFRIFIEDAA
ncbi:hypothetical protein FLA_6234 [Filimonas lacunae]|nr:hypothetical protein FLA_6234 [Filimonas lacunae]